MDLIRIGQYIAGKRKALGLTQKQLAEKLGVSDKSVSSGSAGYVCRTCRSIRAVLRGAGHRHQRIRFRAMIYRGKTICRAGQRRISFKRRRTESGGKRLKCMVAALLIVSAAALSIINNKYLIGRSRPERT